MTRTVNNKHVLVFLKMKDKQVTKSRSVIFETSTVGAVIREKLFCKSTLNKLRGKKRRVRGQCQNVLIFPQFQCFPKGFKSKTCPSSSCLAPQNNVKNFRLGPLDFHWYLTSRVFHLKFPILLVKVFLLRNAFYAIFAKLRN